MTNNVDPDETAHEDLHCLLQITLLTHFDITVTRIARLKINVTWISHKHYLRGLTLLVCDSHVDNSSITETLQKLYFKTFKKKKKKKMKKKKFRLGIELDSKI